MKFTQFIFILLLTFMLSSCSSNENVTSDSEIQKIDDNKVNSPENQNSQTPDTKLPRIIEIDAFNFAYSKTEIKVKLGEKVKIVITNTGGHHDFVIDELGVKTPVIGTSETTSIEFTANKKGSFSFYCSVGSHRAAGMEGLFIVE